LLLFEHVQKKKGKKEEKKTEPHHASGNENGTQSSLQALYVMPEDDRTFIFENAGSECHVIVYGIPIREICAMNGCIHGRN